MEKQPSSSSDDDSLKDGRASRQRGGARPSRLRVALLYNAKEHAPALNGSAPPDIFDELDSLEHVHAMAGALRAAGHAVYEIEGGPDLARQLRRRPVDLCFNTCEGHRGDSREAQIPALLEMLDIPYTAAKVLGLAISLDKAMTKRVLAFHGLPTPRFQEFNRASQPLDPALRFPLFVKPNRQGTAIGINRDSVVYDEMKLRDRVAYLLDAYRETALVEEYVHGRDITCGLIGNLIDPNLPTPPEGIAGADGPQAAGGPADWNGVHLFPLSEVDHSAYEPDRPPIYSHRLKVDLADDYHFLCPTTLPETVGCQIRRLTVETFRATQCLDMCRVDFRLDVRDNLRPYVIEINSLPGVTPISDLTECVKAEGWTYERMINAILDAAVKRHRLARAIADRPTANARRRKISARPSAAEVPLVP